MARSEEFSLVNRAGLPIKSHAEWGDLAKPASDTHWKEGRSAWELAAAWTVGTAAVDLASLLAGAPTLHGLTIETAIAEAQTRFDDHGGGPRNHDLLLIGRSAAGPIVIGIEGKADETYGQTVAAYKAAADKKVQLEQPTNAPDRLKDLLEDLVDSTLAERPELAALRYQLLTGLAGTLTEAQDVNGHAVFVVHEFVTSLTERRKREANHAALRLAVQALFGVDAPDAPAWLIGPLHTRGQRWANIDLWIGQMTTVAPSAGDTN